MENSNEVPSTNGWPEYKRAVLYQMEYLTDEIHRVRDTVTGIDKQLNTFVTKETTDISARDLTNTVAANAKELSDWKMSVISELATTRGENVKGRRTLGIVLVVITIFINFIGLFIEMKLR